MHAMSNEGLAKKMTNLLSAAIAAMRRTNSTMAISGVPRIPETAMRPTKLPTEMVSVLRGWDRLSLQLSHTEGVPAEITQEAAHTLLVSTSPLNVTFRNSHHTYMYSGINRLIMPPGDGVATVEEIRTREDRKAAVSYTCRLFGEVPNPIILPVGFTAGVHQPNLMHPHIAIPEEVVSVGESLLSVSYGARRVVVKGPKNHQIDGRNPYTNEGFHYYGNAFKTIVPFEGNRTDTPSAEILYVKGDGIARMGLRVGEAALIHPNTPNLLLAYDLTIAITSGPEDPAYHVTEDRVDIIPAAKLRDLVLLHDASINLPQDAFR